MSIKDLEVLIDLYEESIKSELNKRVREETIKEIERIKQEIIGRRNGVKIQDI